MKKEFNKNLADLNTFGMSVTAKEFVPVTSADQVKEYGETVRFQITFFHLRAAESNVLFTDDFDGTVIKNEIKGNRLDNRKRKKTLRFTLGQAKTGTTPCCTP